MKPLRLGLLAAALIAGPPLYKLVQQGTLDSVTALQKAGVVAMACAIGVSWLRGLVVSYQADVEIAKRRKAARTQEILRMIEVENAVTAAQAAQQSGGRRARDRAAAKSASAQAATATGAGAGTEPGNTGPA